MLELNGEHHKAYCTWLIERACENKNAQQQATLREFHAQLSASLIALVSGQEALASGQVATSIPLLLKLTELALSIIPVAGLWTGKVLSSVASEAITLEATHLNALLGTQETRVRLIERFCAQATYYHGAQLLHPDETVVSLKDTLGAEVDKLLTQLPLSLPPAQGVLAHKLVLQFAQALGEATKTPHDYPSHEPDKLMGLLTQHVVFVDEAPLQAPWVSEGKPIAFAQHEEAQRWGSAYQDF